MDDLQLRLEQLHPQSFGWAMCCCRRDRETARDVLQEVYLKVLQGKARHGGEGVFKTWLFAVIRRTALEERRKSWLRGLKLTGYWLKRKEATGEAPPPDSERLLAALETLPAQQRDILHLVFYEELSVAEAAEVMGVALGTARTHYHRAKEALRESLDTPDNGRMNDATGTRRTADAGVVL